METFKTTIALAVFLFAPTIALAEEAETKTKPEPRITPLERTLIIPDIIGLRVGSPGIGLAGLVSYSFNESRQGNESSHVESFGINPSFDVRAGRFTVGGALRINHLYQRFGTASGTTVSRSGSVAVVPRIGMLFPIVKHVTLWPRIGVGPTAASSEFEGAFAGQHSTSAGIIVSTDALVVVDLGSHFFANAGPTASFFYTVGEQTLGTERSAQFQIGATVSVGMSF